jgi:hypothetical protein
MNSVNTVQAVNQVASLKSPAYLHRMKLQYSPAHEVQAVEQVIERNQERLSASQEPELTLRERMEVQRLQQIDRSVREHEHAHQRAALDLAVSGPNFELERGPDGKKYAVGGEVNIDASLVGADAGQTIEKALKIQRAALAPNDPSPKDLRAATQARIVESKAHRKLSRDETLEVAVENKVKDLEKPEDQLFNKSLPPGFSQYKENLEFQKNLSNMLDLFT